MFQKPYLIKFLIYKDIEGFFYNARGLTGSHGKSDDDYQRKRVKPFAKQCTRNYTNRI